MVKDYYVVLAGGVGASKFIEGLVSVVKPELIKIIVNTGDDIELFGLKISPDLDIITYTLANVVDKEKGWGFASESFNCLNILEKYYDFKWFNAGDKDLATHIYRTDLFNKGLKKSEITKKICQKLGVKVELIPMCNESVETYIETPTGKIHFEEYFIKHRCQPEVLGVELKGVDKARPVEGALKSLEESKGIIFCPSNPIVSIGTILQVKGIKETLIKERNKVVGITPIVAGSTVKGPADKIMKGLGMEVSCVGVAKYYKDVLGHFVIDQKDSQLAPKLEKLGVRAYVFDTIMSSFEKKKALAQFVVDIIK